MKKVIYGVLVILILSGWIWVKKDKPVITIGSIKVTKKEFERAFATSQFTHEAAGAKAVFLDIFISRKLILREAERLGLDKDPAFLEDVQLFWEQALLKRTLARKVNELSAGIMVTDKEVRNFYVAYKEDRFPNKELSEVYGEIKMLLFKDKQVEAVERWSESLKDKARITIDYQALGINPSKKAK